MSCFYMRNKKGAVSSVSCDVGDTVLSVPRFYSPIKAKIKKEKPNVIKIVLDTIGLVLDNIPCGELPKYDIHNMSALQVLKLGLLEGIKDKRFYDLCLSEEGVPIILSVGEEDFVPKVVYYSVVHDFEKVDYCVIVKGLDPMPERLVKDSIPLIVNGEGKGVEIIGLGKFQYTACGNKVFDYHGCISYGDPNLQDTTKDEMDSAFELEPFESLIGYVYTCKKPEDVDVFFSDTTQLMLNFDVGLGRQGFVRTLDIEVEKDSVSLGIDVTDEYIARDRCQPCVFLEPENLIVFYESNTAILSVDQAIVTYHRINNYKTSGEHNYSDFCSPDSIDDSSDSFSYRICDLFDENIVTRQLNIGQDFYYKIESEPLGINEAGSEIIKYTLKAGIPYMYPYKVAYDNVFYSSIIKFAGSSSHVFVPFKGVALVSIDKPSIQIKKETDTAIGQLSKVGEAFVEDHTEIIKEIAKDITLCATPIVTLDKPSNTAYYVNGSTTLIKMEDCIQDNDPTTEEDLENTPCEIMAEMSSGKATVDVTLPFLETDEEIEGAASLLGEKFSASYKQSVSTVPGHSVSASDLGKRFNGGIINKIVWSYQDKSFYKATITSGPFLTGVDSFNTSMWIRRTDQNLSREGIVMGDYGNGLEFKVYVRNIGTYTALNMTMSTIEVGDAVNVTIYNNPAEAYYE